MILTMSATISRCSQPHFYEYRIVHIFQPPPRYQRGWHTTRYLASILGREYEYRYKPLSTVLYSALEQHMYQVSVCVPLHEPLCNILYTLHLSSYSPPTSLPNIRSYMYSIIPLPSLSAATY